MNSSVFWGIYSCLDFNWAQERALGRRRPSIPSLVWAEITYGISVEVDQ